MSRGTDTKKIGHSAKLRVKCYEGKEPVVMRETTGAVVVWVEVGAVQLPAGPLAETMTGAN